MGPRNHAKSASMSPDGSIEVRTGSVVRFVNVASPTMPFANLPDTHKSRWGDELTAEKMKEWVWHRPEIVAQIEFLEWTEADRLRHSKFVGLREDKNPTSVVKENRDEA